MDYEEIVKNISATLRNLEEQGELVITSTIPDHISRSIFHAAIEAWLKGSGVEIDPMECTMQYLLDQTCSELSRRFSINPVNSKKTVNSYYVKWCETRTIKEIAEIYWHETPSEMARRAYYCIELGKSDNRDLDYLEWRKQYVQ